MLARELDTERALLRGLMDSTADLISFKDLDGRFVRLNASKASSLGHPARRPASAAGSAISSRPSAPP